MAASDSRPERAIARILDPRYSSATPCGAAVLIAPGYALTCAHAVNTGLGRERHARDWPQAPVPWDLPARGIQQRLAKVLHWCAPAAPDDAGGPADIAVLAIDPPLPQGTPTLALAHADANLAPTTIGHAYGFPDYGSDGIWAKGELSGHQSNGWRQIRDLGEPVIKPGFSGGPLLDPTRQCVIAMVVARHQWYPLSYAIPTETLKAAWPALAAIAGWREMPRDTEPTPEPEQPQHHSEAHQTVNVVVQVPGQTERPPPAEPQPEPTPTTPPETKATGGPPVLTLKLERQDDEIRIAPWPDPGPGALPSTASLGALRQALKQEGPDALFKALLGTPPAVALHLSQMSATDGLADPTQAPLRLRLICTDPDLADLPWHCLSHAGCRLGERGWVIELLTEPDGGERAIALDNPLVVVPDDQDARLGARMHAADVRIHIRRLLADQRTRMPWVSRRREIEAELADDPPDLIYCLAEVTADGRLDLGRDQIAIADLLPPSADAAQRPILWLHLLEGREHKLARADLLALRERTLALIVQSARPASPERSLKNTSDLMQAMADCAEPAAAVARFDDRGLRCWLGRDSIRLRPEPDAAMRARIRQALIRILLGRTNEKLLLRHHLSERPAGSLLLYAACGERDACVHDFPEQLRQFIDDSPDGALQLTNRPLPWVMRPGDSVDGLIDRLKQDLSIGPGRPPEEALRDLPVVRPAHEDAPVLALSWLLRVDPELGPTIGPGELADWIGRWKEAVTSLFEPAEIPQGHRLLAGACIEWPAAWFDGPAGTTQAELHRQASGVLRRRNPGHVHSINLGNPLGLLTLDDLLDFYRSPDDALRGRLTRDLYKHDNDEDDLVDYLLRKAKGRFEPTADLIYQEYKHGYADFRADQDARRETTKP